MKIRVARKSDQEQIINIYNQAVKEGFCTADMTPVTIESRQNWFKIHEPDKYPIFVVERNNNILGWCSISPYRPGREALRKTAEISYYIHENHRRKGLGSKLLEHAINKCPELGIKNIFAILLDVNTPSIKILEKYDFKKWGHLPDVADFNGNICGQYVFGRKV